MILYVVLYKDESFCLFKKFLLAFSEPKNTKIFLFKFKETIFDHVIEDQDKKLWYSGNWSYISKL